MYPGQSGYAATPPPSGAAGYSGGPPAGAAPPQSGPPPAGFAPGQGSAPSADQMEKVSGYEDVGMNAEFLLPPQIDPSNLPGPPEHREFRNVPSITEEQAREALLHFVSEHCCYGKGAATELKFTDLRSSSAFHYTLETFTEARQTAWTFEPYTGQPVDGPQNGHAPGPWDIHVNPPGQFVDGTVKIEVPHTASLKPCHQCAAIGRVRCDRCMGDGGSYCHTCNGTGRERYYEDGHHHHRSCCWCNGSGRRRCTHCSGHGQITCPTCAGRANLKWFIRLTVNWHNHLGDHIVERTPLPDELIRSVSGQIAFEESQPKVWPINHFPDQEVNNASNSLIRQHESAFSSERQLQQRHRVRIVPVTQAFYKFKGQDSSFFVYGFEHKVHAPDYPQKCCCGCQIL
ncbi:protein SSUH2 homolog isoform X2 [Liolophura sinensis]|uniref:protein SSUH2 homolog isoform X2 n=1 Tax=Liolophura sinensis TaxID=3198878 RepID=UPI003158A2DC